MNVAVLGLWHLGSVTAACVAAAGHRVRGWDLDTAAVTRLAAGQPPIYEPGLEDLTRTELASGRLTVTTDIRDAVAGAEIVWITFDTPVDDDDRADVEFVVERIEYALPSVPAGAMVLVSSQLPVGTCRRIEAICAARHAERQLSVACAPENLRLGCAITTFTQPDRVVVGVRADRDRARLTELFRPITDRIEWMSVESAEMTKHAVNAFLATSIAFINEIASLAEHVGADARDVARGLKTEHRIGPHAYLNPGAAFAGGTLARDVTFLRSLGADTHSATAVIDGVQAGNIAHRVWVRERLGREVQPLTGRRVAVWGLTNKPGTDTVRRSEAIALCRWLMGEGVSVAVHDPLAGELPDDLRRAVDREQDPIVAATAADALVVATQWPLYRDVNVDRLAAAMRGHLVLDPNRFLGSTLGADPRFKLIAVGQPHV